MAKRMAKKKKKRIDLQDDVACHCCIHPLLPVHAYRTYRTGWYYSSPVSVYVGISVVSVYFCIYLYMWIWVCVEVIVDIYSYRLFLLDGKPRNPNPAIGTMEKRK